MAYDSIPDGWRAVGQPVKKDLVDRIHDNLEDLNGRVTNVEGSISTQIVANDKIKKERDNQPLGTIVWSTLSVAQFAAESMDGDWALADGSSAAGTDYATTSGRGTRPDLRGKFLRGKDHGAGNNPDGDTALGTAQGQATAAHTHTINHGHSHTISASGTFASSSHTHSMSHVHGAFYQNNLSASELYGIALPLPAQTTIDATDTKYIQGVARAPGAAATMGGNYTGIAYTTGVISPPSGSNGSTAATGTPSATASVGNSGSVTDYSGSSGSTGSATETRPINTTENAFVKINRNYLKVGNGYLLWRAPQALTINQVVLTPVTQGTSGTLTVDIKKGVHGSISTSIFTAAPNLVYSDTTPQTGTLNATNSQIAAGEYVRVDITATQAKLQEFHILIAATPS